jgi:hypothetical protein
MMSETAYLLHQAVVAAAVLLGSAALLPLLAAYAHWQATSAILYQPRCCVSAPEAQQQGQQCQFSDAKWLCCGRPGCTCLDDRAA